LFATKAVNDAGANGLFYGNPAQFLIQLVTVVVVVIFAFGVTFMVAKLLNRFMGLRVSASEEQVGLDISEHGERAYA
jgi:Amt family ammonium transporter